MKTPSDLMVYTKLYIVYYEFFMKNDNQKVSTERKIEVV